MKHFYLFILVLILTGWLAVLPCLAAPQKVDELYRNFLKSEEWKSFFPKGEGNLGAALVDEYQIEQYKIFDIDNDGNLELWFCASMNDGSVGIRGKDCVSAVAVYHNGKIQKLLTAEMSSGSIGGSLIQIAYDLKNKEHCFFISNSTGGDGNSHSRNDYYTIKNGSADCFLRTYSCTNLNTDKTIYEINDKSVDEKMYNETLKRFSEPLKPSFILDYYKSNS